MGIWGLSTRRMPTIRSYADALNYYDKKPAVRRRKDGWKPIEPRRSSGGYNWSKAMTKLPDGSVVFRLFGTDCVTYHPDGTITLVGHETVSTGIFMGCLAPLGLRYWAKRGALISLPVNRTRMWVRNPDREKYRGSYIANPHGDVYALKTGQALRIKLCRDKWQPVDPSQQAQLRWTVLDKEKAAQLRSEYKVAQFRTWHRTVTKLLGEPRVTAPSTNGAVYGRWYDASRAGEFGCAATWLHVGTLWYRRDGMWRAETKVSSSAFQKLYRQLYRDHGAYQDHSATCLTCYDYVRLIYNARL